MVEAVAEHMGFTKEAIKKAKEKEEIESKKPKNERIPSQSKPKETKSSSTPVKSSTTQILSRKGVLKKKRKPKRTYVVVSLVAFETESNKETKKENKKGEFVRVISKPQSGGAQLRKKAQFEPSLTDMPKRGRRLRTKFDKDLEFGKVEDTVELKGEKAKETPKDVTTPSDDIDAQVEDKDKDKEGKVVAREEVDKDKKRLTRILVGETESVQKETKSLVKKALGLIPNEEEKKDEVIEDNTPKKPKLEEFPKGVKITDFELDNKYMQDDPIDTESIDIIDDDIDDANNVANTFDNTNIFEVDVQKFEHQQE
ncbi:uncharacterized protein LOC131876529 [Cryptomeria japonica]|uniref:uncharacterized protein LOC131876529 n=1 Tax=Cryptomeria japonica TaxID=3369 RepID=UPI0027DA7E4B|nr:uncharacterized protein LOC131876529 [Cryptomeria japonica]